MVAAEHRTNFAFDTHITLHTLHTLDLDDLQQ